MKESEHPNEVGNKGIFVLRLTQHPSSSRIRAKCRKKTDGTILKHLKFQFLPAQPRALRLARHSENGRRLRRQRRRRRHHRRQRARNDQFRMEEREGAAAFL